MKKVHITITTLTLLIQIGLIITLFYMAQNIITLKTDFNNQINLTKTDLEKQITNTQQRSDDKLLELNNNLALTENTLTKQIKQIKADSSSDFSEIIPNLLKGVVSIGTDAAQGSGFLITNDGYIVTNAHVLSGGHYVRVLTYQADKWVSAKLIGYNEDMDIAILKIDGNYQSLELGDSSTVQIGQKAIALGNPLGLSFSVSEGIISARDRDGPNKKPIYFQVDVPLNPGNSGGPLIDKNGKVIGINNFKLQNFDNLGFALESNSAKQTVNQIFQDQNLTISI